MKFAVRLGLGYGAPALLYCVVINQALPLVVAVVQLAVGVLAGFWLYERRPGGFTTLAPAGPDAEAQSGTPPLLSRQPLRPCPAHGA